ncbi:MAG: hypothetical protein Q8P10_02615 [bacterium]|nr:hypothetical protein [bacterium]
MSLKTQAIQTALEGDWENAINLNLKLLKENPNDSETLNRLAFAYIIIGKIINAKKTYLKVLKLDNQNPIALRNLKRLSLEKKLKKSSRPPSFILNINSMFIEESGKTKVIELINLAEPKRISHLMAGELLIMSIKRLKIFVLDEKNQYIGMLPDDIGKRLIKFLKGGNSYQTFVKSIEDYKVSIFIKEVNRSSKFKNEASFMSMDKKTLSRNTFKEFEEASEQEE